MITQQIDGLLQRLDLQAPTIEERDRRYRGVQKLRYAADEISGDLKFFSVNLYRLAVDAVAERMRVRRLQVTVRNRDVSPRAEAVWVRSNMDQLLQPVIVDALALGSAYLIVWAGPDGSPVITPEPATQVAVDRDPITGAVTGAVKRWYALEPSGAVTAEHVVHYTPEKITHYRRTDAGDWSPHGEPVDNPLGVVPVIPLINTARVGDTRGHSVIDDLGHLVDALSKIMADMLVASEDVARPRRWATGVELEEDYDNDGFTADAEPVGPSEPRPAVSPFESGNRMFTVESPDAKFGQLPGADLQGYRTAVDLIMQQIMAVSALPAHMVGITSANPSSADAIRAAEASLTARAESRIRVLGIALEQAVSLAVAIAEGVHPREVHTVLKWADPSTKSDAQEADAVSKLHALGIVTTAEAREAIGVDSL